MLGGVQAEILSHIWMDHCASDVAYVILEERDSQHVVQKHAGSSWLKELSTFRSKNHGS